MTSVSAEGEVAKWEFVPLSVSNFLSTMVVIVHLKLLLAARTVQEQSLPIKSLGESLLQLAILVDLMNSTELVRTVHPPALSHTKHTIRW